MRGLMIYPHPVLVTAPENECRHRAHLCLCSALARTSSATMIGFSTTAATRVFSRTLFLSNQRHRPQSRKPRHILKPERPPRASPPTYLLYGVTAHPANGQGMSAWHSISHLIVLCNSIFEVCCWSSFFDPFCAQLLPKLHQPPFGWDKHVLFSRVNLNHNFILLIRYSIIVWHSNMKSACSPA